jgi:aryl-alcohol dehydrogenase-like predicted oxidoreductase
MTKFIIGTAQFGMDYGVANSNGQPSESTIREIIECATENEVFYYDTAISYGNSEEILGKIFGELKIHQLVKVFTKIPKRTEVDSLGSIAESIKKSLSRLKTEQLFGLLIHSEFDHLHLEELSKIKEAGFCKHIGLSTGHDSSFNSKILKNQNLELLQIPANLLDRRNLIPTILDNAVEKRVIVRSIYLQGLFSMLPQAISEFHKPLKPLLKRLNQIAQEFEMTLNELALRYILSYSPSYVVIGAESIAQFQKNLAWFKRDPLKKEILDRIHSVSFDLDLRLITPNLWPK